MELLLIAGGFVAGFLVYRWFFVVSAVTPEQMQAALEDQKVSLRESVRSMIQKAQDALTFSTRFETNLEGMFEQMETYEMEVTNPEAYDAMIYLLKYRVGEDRINDRIELRGTAQRGVKLEVHYVSIKPEE